jgi:hypothetical protein
MENQVREISLRQLFWKVMMGWKLWIVCAVLFAILLPGVKYAKDVRAYHAAQQPKDEKQEPTVVLTDDEQQQIDDVKSRFFVRVSGHAAERQSEIEELFGKAEIVAVPSLSEEFAFITGEITEQEYREKAEKLDGIQSRIRARI